MKEMIILRGLPGSGKSTFAKLLSNINEHHIICSADNFLYENGEYIWSYERVHDAHKQCKLLVKESMQNSIPLIIVDNVHTKYKKMIFYKDLAKHFKYNVSTIIVENTYGTQSIHNTSNSRMDEFKQMFEVKL